MADLATLRANAANRQAAVDRLVAVKKPTPKQIAALVTDYRGLANAQAVLIAALTEIVTTFGDEVIPPGSPLPVDTFGFFTEGSVGDTSPYLHGGTPAGNPNGPDYSPDQAVRWFKRVWNGKVNYSKVRPTLLPGGHVLTPAGQAFAEEFQKRSDLTEAPEDYNPLGLTVVE